MDIARVFKWWHGIIRHRYFEFKIYASIVTNAFCGLHNDKYKKYLPHKKFRFRACIESLRAYEKFKISERKVNFFKGLDL